MKWFKFYGQDWLTDLKVMKMSMEDRLCFLTLLCLASSTDEDGTVRNCDEETLIKLANIPNDPNNEYNPHEKAIGCLKRFEALQIVTLRVTHRNGALQSDVTVRNFSSRQEKNLSNAERQKRYRDSHKISKEDSNYSNVTQRNARNVREEKRRIEEREGRDKSEFIPTTHLGDLPEVEKKENTPSHTARSFLTGGAVYNEMLSEFSKGENKSGVESEFKKFVLYWTEPNKGGTKQRWEQQPTFEIRRRLLTWLSRSKEWNIRPTKNVGMSVASEIKL